MTAANPGTAEDIAALEAMRAADAGIDYYAAETLIRAVIIAQVGGAIEATRKRQAGAEELCRNAALWAGELGFEIDEDCLIASVEEVAAKPKPKRRSSK